MDTTRQVNKVIVHENILNKVIYTQLYTTLAVMCREKYAECQKKFFENDWIDFSFNGQRGYWHKKTQLAVPVQKEYFELYDKYFDIERTELDFGTAEMLFGKGFPNEIMAGISASNAFEGCHLVGVRSGSYCVENGRCADWNNGDSVQVGVVKIKTADFEKAVLSKKYDIQADKVLKALIDILHGTTIDMLSEIEINKVVEIFDINKKEIIKEVANKVMINFSISDKVTDEFTDTLLNCDKVRADLERYDKKCLEDINEGHWQLWNDDELKAENGQLVAALDKPLIARNPIADIHFDGLIGIDFGTKSTIVSKQDGRKKTSLLRVGIGQLNKAAEAHHYENPTIMEFINLEKFLKDYNSGAGRPETSIDDLRVSHAANNDLRSCTVSDTFYSFFYDIKQWCGDKTRKIKIKDQSALEDGAAKEWELPHFVDIGKDSFNPLEIYAYYLGLYINNMRNGIYLDYILSFPVTYEKAVKEKILESFTNGLKKSLPETVLNNAEIMNTKFRVRQGVSEPAAYAITALQGYGFTPDEDEKIMYSIFDFGGGTTDFDFGIWRCSDDRIREEQSYDYVIEHFGSEGDKFLGGENLLELMAFEIFKANAKMLQKGKKRKSEQNDSETSGFSFSKPRECDEFVGSETLISNSQEARRNTKQLMEALRPFWEGIIGIENKYISESKETLIYNGYIFRNEDGFKFPVQDGSITVDLFDKDGRRQQSQKLYTENKEENINVNLIEILENRIEQGVKNFFQAVITAFRNKTAVESGVNEINIFLAGNSSKSPVLRKLFDKYIEDMNNSFKESGASGEHFYLFPPLGTKEAMEIQKERGIKYDENDISAPTGKTGVAYGLIAGRESGRIKVVSEITAERETKFRYYIVIEKRGKFKMVLDRNIVEYGEWIRFGVARKDFEFYYSSLPGVCKMSPDEASIPLKHCHIDEVNNDSDIYIRATAPEEIEYCVMSKDEVPDEDVEGFTVYLGE